MPALRWMRVEMKWNGRSHRDPSFRSPLAVNLDEFLELQPCSHLVITSTLLTKQCSKPLRFQILLLALLMLRLRRVVLPYNSSLAHLLLRTKKKNSTSLTLPISSSTILSTDGWSPTKVSQSMVSH